MSSPQRTIAGRTWCQFGQHRAAATRYDKYDLACRETADLASTRVWLIILFHDPQDAL
jgi:hypothetical protein